MTDAQPLIHGTTEWAAQLAAGLDGVKVDGFDKILVGVSLTDKKAESAVLSIGGNGVDVLGGGDSTSEVQIELPSTLVKSIADNPRELAVGFMQGAVKMVGHSGVVIALLKATSSGADLEAQ